MNEGEPFQPEGEFHHFQLINSEGEVPMSISILIHLNPQLNRPVGASPEPISTDDVLELHQALEAFDGDFISAFHNK